MLGDLVRDGDRIIVATGPSEPPTLIDELLDVAEQRRIGFQLVQVLTGSREAILSASARHTVRPIVQGRRQAGQPHVDVLPMSMSQLARSIASGELPVDGVLFSGRCIGGDRVNFGICIDVVEVACERARFRAVEINDALPLVPGPLPLPLARCEYVIRSTHPPLALPSPVRSPAATAIGENVATLVDDGSVVEIGLGRSLSGVAEALVNAGRRIAVHSGLLSDWTQTLVDNGIADRPLACADGVAAVGTASMGTSDFYSWLDRRETVRLVDSRHAHDPGHLAGLGSFVAINAASRIDCAGQVGAEGVATARMAVGGLLDFAVAGAYGGRSIVALESVDAHGRSRLVPRLSTVQLPASLVTHVVTEYGIARLTARTWSERARELITVAHPDHRADLRREMSG